jgi:hypothetical protein
MAPIRGDDGALWWQTRPMESGSPSVGASMARDPITSAFFAAMRTNFVVTRQLERVEKRWLA